MTEMSKLQGQDCLLENGLSNDEERALTNFILLEAQYADESRYDEWEALWSSAADATYWVPRGPHALDPEKYVSLIFDNRARLATRIRQLKTGYRFAQIPVSPMRRVVSNIVMRPSSNEGADGEKVYEVESNFILVEIAVQSTNNQNIWAGRTLHRIQWEDGQLKLHSKRILLVNGDEPIASIAFLL